MILRLERERREIVDELSEQTMLDPLSVQEMASNIAEIDVSIREMQLELENAEGMIEFSTDTLNRHREHQSEIRMEGHREHPAWMDRVYT